MRFYYYCSDNALGWLASWLIRSFSIFLLTLTSFFPLFSSLRRNLESFEEKTVLLALYKLCGASCRSNQCILLGVGSNYLWTRSFCRRGKFDAVAWSWGIRLKHCFLAYIASKRFGDSCYWHETPLSNLRNSAFATNLQLLPTHWNFHFFISFSSIKFKHLEYHDLLPEFPDPLQYARLASDCTADNDHAWLDEHVAATNKP